MSDVPVPRRLREVAGLVGDRAVARCKRSLVRKNCTRCRRGNPTRFSLCLRCRRQFRRRCERRKKGGLCQYCGSPSVPGRASCRRCIARHSAWNALRARSLRKARLCPRCGKVPQGAWKRCASCRAYERGRARIRWMRIRQRLISLYGGKCSCCEEGNPIFLALDHVHNDGHLERRLNRSPSRLFGKILRRKRVDPRYQLLCWNCNAAKAYHGSCPHQSARNGVARAPLGPAHSGG